MLTTNPWNLPDPDLRDQLAQVFAILLENLPTEPKENYRIDTPKSPHDDAMRPPKRIRRPGREWDLIYTYWTMKQDSKFCSFDSTALAFSSTREQIPNQGKCARPQPTNRRLNGRTTKTMSTQSGAQILEEL